MAARTRLAIRPEDSRKEVLGGKASIERATAIKWAGRAIAAWKLYEERREIAWRDDAVEYASEAIEHGAASGSDAVLRTVRHALRRASPTLV